MNITFSKNAWEDYISWQKEDKKILRKINELIKVIQSLRDTILIEVIPKNRVPADIRNLQGPIHTAIHSRRQPTQTGATIQHLLAAIQEVILRQVVVRVHQVPVVQVVEAEDHLPDHLPVAAVEEVNDNSNADFQKF